MKFDFDKKSNVLNERLIQTAADNINNNAENSAELTGKSFSGKLDMREFTLDQMVDMVKTQLQYKGYVEKDGQQFKTFPCYQFINLTYEWGRILNIYLCAGVTPKHHKKYRLYLHDIFLEPSTGWNGCSFGIYINGEQRDISLSRIQSWYGFYINAYTVGSRELNPNFNEEESPWDNFNNLLLMVDILMKNIEPIKKLIEHEADRLYDNGYMPSKHGDNIAKQTSENIGLHGTLEIILRENRISTTNIPASLRKKVLPLL
jgi:hypothetical protein